MWTASPLNKILGTTLLLSGFVRGGELAEPVFVQQNQSVMGTKWHIALYADSTEAANGAAARAWKEIQEIDTCLTNYVADSELNRFCKSAPHSQFIKVSEHLANVLRAASDVSRSSDGYFDVTIGPIANLWRRARAKHQLPNQDRLAEARGFVNWRHIDFADAHRQVRISKPGVKIDLGGIAKGYAVDRALACLRVPGVLAALVNGGGDLAAFGRAPDTNGWVVQIGDNTAHAPSSRQLTLRDAALATSGDAWQYLEIEGTRYSHIIDPKTGIGSTRRRTVSVVAPTCMTADAWASAMTVMPSEQSQELVQRMDHLEVRMVEAQDDDLLKEWKSAGFPPFHPQL